MKFSVLLRIKLNDQVRSVRKYTLKDSIRFKTQLLYWAQQFEDVVWLDSNQYTQQYSSYDMVLAVDAFTSLKTDYSNGFEALKEYQEQTADWIFGYLSYDLKNDTEDLVSDNFDGLHFPDLYFFQPKKLFLIKDNVLEMEYLRMVDDEFTEDFEAISEISEPIKISSKHQNGKEKSPCENVRISLKMTKDLYKRKGESNAKTYP